jgi:hypothetical protein
MELSLSWEVNICIHSDGQEIPRPLWNQKCHYHVYKIQPLDTVLSVNRNFLFCDKPFLIDVLKLV